MVEIEIGVLRTRCLERRIGERERLASEIAAWRRERRASSTRIHWKFSTAKARENLAPTYLRSSIRSKITFAERKRDSASSYANAPRFPQLSGSEFVHLLI